MVNLWVMIPLSFEAVAGAVDRFCRAYLHVLCLTILCKIYFCTSGVGIQWLTCNTAELKGKPSFPSTSFDVGISHFDREVFLPMSRVWSQDEDFAHLNCKFNHPLYPDLCLGQRLWEKARLVFVHHRNKLKLKKYATKVALIISLTCKLNMNLCFYFIYPKCSYSFVNKILS